MKRIFFVFILLALALGACSPAVTPTVLPSAVPSTPNPNPTSAPSTPAAVATSTSGATAVHTQKAPPTPTVLSSATQAAPTPTPFAGVIATQTAPDCAVFPGFPSCGASLPLSGKLATFDAASQTITVLDFDARLAWKINAPPEAKRLEWLGGGNFLVTYNNQGVPALAWTSPVTSKTLDLPKLSPAGTPVFTAADGSTAWIEMKDNQSFFHVRLGKTAAEKVWPAGEPGDQIHQILGWVPGTPLLLAGYTFSGNSMWMTGDRLYTLDPASGTIQEMAANLRLGGPFQWHPTQAGLIVFGDSNPSSMMAGPRLAVLDVVTGKVAHPIADESVVSSYPSWSADGKAILHAASKVGSPTAASDPFALPAVYLTQWPDGATRRLTTPPAGSRDDWPQLLPDGKHFLYLRVPDGGGPAELRLGSLDGSQDDFGWRRDKPGATGTVPPELGSIIAYAP